MSTEFSYLRLVSVVVALASSQTNIVSAQQFRRFEHRDSFLALALGQDATGPLDNCVVGGSSASCGEVTFTNAGGSGIFAGCWTPILEGDDLALSGNEDLDVELPAPAFGFAVEIVEPTHTGATCSSGGCNTASCVQSTFTVTLFLGVQQVGSPQVFQPKDDIATLIGLWSDAAFDTIRIRETAGTADNEYFGRAYTSRQPLQPQFQVNTYTPGRQEVPAVASMPDGTFLVVWEGRTDHPMDDTTYNIHGRLYDSSGSPNGDELTLNTYLQGNQRRPNVTASGPNDLVVVWHSSSSSESDQAGYSVQAQRYQADGSALGAQFQVNSYTTNDQYYPTVAAADDGSFVVAWQSYGSAGSDSAEYSIQAQRFDPVGAPQGNEFQVNSFTSGSQSGADVAVGTDGSFVVDWASYGSYQGDPYYSIQARPFASNGSATGNQIQVNTYTTGTQYGNAVASAPGGSFVIVWDSRGSPEDDDYSDYSVQGRFLAPDGSPIGAQFQVNAYVTGGQYTPDVAFRSDGGFMVVWESFGSFDSDLSGKSVQGRVFDASGSPVGSDIQINTYTTGTQSRTRVAALSDGNFVVVWRSYGSLGDDNSVTSVQAQIVLTPVLFVDGFESGDVTAWSDSVP